MRMDGLRSLLLSVLAGSFLAATLAFSLSKTARVEAEDWCDPPAGCAFGGCVSKTINGQVVKQCKFFKTVNEAVCTATPTCGTAPGGGGDLPVDPPEN